MPSSDAPCGRKAGGSWWFHRELLRTPIPAPSDVSATCNLRGCLVASPESRRRASLGERLRCNLEPHGGPRGAARGVSYQAAVPSATVCAPPPCPPATAARSAPAVARKRSCNSCSASVCSRRPRDRAPVRGPVSCFDAATSLHADTRRAGLPPPAGTLATARQPAPLATRPRAKVRARPLRSPLPQP